MEPDQIAEFVSNNKNKLISENVAGHYVKGGYKITMKRGTVIFATEVQPSPDNPELLWVGQGAAGQYRKKTPRRGGKNINKKPSGWATSIPPVKVEQGTPGYPIWFVKDSGGIMFKYPKFITMSIHNVDSIERT